MKIAWSIGHYPAVKGAWSGPLQEWEHDIAREVVFSGIPLLGTLGYEVIFMPFCSLKEKIRAINKAGVDIAVESHFNSSTNVLANGCETLYFSLPFMGGKRFSKKGKLLAECIQKSTLRCLNRVPDRAVKDRGTKGMADIRRIYRGPKRSLWRRAN